MKVEKAVIPAAGLGTRFLPATKAQPKEMMPVVEKPTIQYVVEEAVNSGIDDILIITGRGKRSIEAHFDKSYELEEELKQAGKKERLDRIQKISDLVDIHYVRQKERAGLGDAVLYAEKHIGDQPFALLLGDTIVKGEKPCTRRLIERAERSGKPVISLENVPLSAVSVYGIAEPADEPGSDGCFPIKDLVEKPSMDEAPSTLAIAGRYVLNPEVFDLLRDTEKGVRSELQLTDALRKMDGLLGLEMEGDRYDIGNIPDWLKANVELALKDGENGVEIEQFLNALLNDDDVE